MLIEIPEELVKRCRQRLQAKPSDSKSLLNRLCRTVAYGEVTTDQPDTFDTRIFWYAVLSAFGVGMCAGLFIGLVIWT